MPKFKAGGRVYCVKADYPARRWDTAIVQRIIGRDDTTLAGLIDTAFTAQLGDGDVYLLCLDHWELAPALVALPKFKVGDVVCCNAQDYPARVDDVATVVDAGDGTLFQVQWGDGAVNMNPALWELAGTPVIDKDKEIEELRAVLLDVADRFEKDWYDCMAFQRCNSYLIARAKEAQKKDKAS